MGAYSGNLNIRPKYQREFVYEDKQRNAVIETISRGFPLNSIYWVRQTEDKDSPEFEVLDGQQRTISICEYYEGNFSVNERYFHNLENNEKEKFLDYELMIYVCEGSDSEKLEWFRVINIAGEKLAEQELRNAIYTSAWLSDAKRRFSKRNCLAEQKGNKYISAVAIRQEILELALSWITGISYEKKGDDKAICEYMAKVAKDEKNSDKLWGYFSNVIDWVEMKFPKYRKEMKGLEWGLFYNEFKDKSLDKDELEEKISALMQDDEIQSKKGIYAYALSGNEKHLNLRTFSENIKREVFEAQNGICKKCNKKCDIEQMEADHIKPWSKGGKTEKQNCQMLCKTCNRTKSNK
ncbi:HNH endonuclease family protein [Campylobacter sp. LR196d]|uniref:HNH endonuclease family protein n=1 Tax=Campylobacter sp. LR196d TaxID=2593543 RepID=UPI0021DF6500|nr:DUF262 domain-containing protein [Campylobacter sp. LR196d]